MPDIPLPTITIGCESCGTTAPDLVVCDENRGWKRRPTHVEGCPGEYLDGQLSYCPICPMPDDEIVEPAA